MADFNLKELSLYLFTYIILIPFLMVLYLGSMMDPVFSSDLMIWLLIFAQSSLTIVSALLIVKIIMTIRVLRNPCSTLFEKTERIDDAHPISKLVNDLRMREGLGHIEVLVSNYISGVKSIGNPLGTSFLVLPKSIAESLDEDQIQSIVFHEFYHIKEDLKRQTTTAIGEYLLDVPVSLMALLYFGLFAMVILYVAFSLGGTLVAGSNIAGIRAMIWPLGVFIAVFCSYIPVFFLVAKSTEKEIGPIKEADYMYTRELFADAYSFFKTLRPEKLSSALIDSRRLEIDSIRRIRERDNKKLLQAGFIESVEPVNLCETKTLKDMFKTEATTIRKEFFRASHSLGLKSVEYKTDCPLRSRLQLINILNKLLNGYVRLCVRKSTFDFKTPISTSLPTPVYRYLKKNPYVFASFNQYLERNSQKFNIKVCSNELKVPAFEVFLMLIGDVELGLVDFEEETE